MNARIIKEANSVSTVTINMSRTAFIWIFFILFNVPGHEEFKYLQLVGFIVVVIGTLTYNGAWFHESSTEVRLLEK